uniref:Uncharacterized protein n=1 Tax=Setaria italica TaxID=4555 RepID=K3ZNQ1_SETIT
MKATQNPHDLGAGGYAAKIAKWRRKEEEQRRAGLPDMLEGLDKCSRNWIVIDFEDLHKLYRQQHLNVNLISVWCLMQWREEELTNSKFKAAYLDPTRISEPEYKLKMTEMIKAQMEAAQT